MNCKLINEDIPACYNIPNMIEVRASFLWFTEQHDRLWNLRIKVYNNGMLLNYIKPVGFKGSWRIV